MKRFVSLFALLAVLAMCAPSYGYILIYKAQIYGKAQMFDEDTYGAITYGKVKAYIVLAVGEGKPTGISIESPIPDFCDGILDGEVIFYDRYKGPKFYAEDDPGMDLISGENSVGIAINRYGGPYALFVVGTLKPTKIGFEEKVFVAKDLAGSMLIDGGFMDLFGVFGAATVTATLETNLTKMANTVDVESEYEAFQLTIDAIVNALEDKGFEPLPD